MIKNDKITTTKNWNCNSILIPAILTQIYIKCFFLISKKKNEEIETLISLFKHSCVSKKYFYLFENQDAWNAVNVQWTTSDFPENFLNKIHTKTPNLGQILVS